MTSLSYYYFAVFALYFYLLFIIFRYSFIVFYKYMIINDNAEMAAKELSAIIAAEHCHFDSELAGKYLL